MSKREPKQEKLSQEIIDNLTRPYPMTPEEQLIQESKRFTENVGKCHHEFMFSWDGDQSYIAPDELCKKCGTRYYVWQGTNPRSLQRCNDNPTYTIELIRSELERCGKWDGFVEWHTLELYNFQEPEWGEPPLRIWVLDYQRTHRASADILTTPLLLLQAANSYMEEK